MKSFEQFRIDVFKRLEDFYRWNNSQVEQDFLQNEETILKNWYNDAVKNKRIETHYDIEVSEAAWGLDLLF